MRETHPFHFIPVLFVASTLGCNDDSATSNGDAVLAGAGGLTGSGAASNGSTGGALGSGGTSNVALSTSAMLASINSPEQAQALCRLLETRLKKPEYERMVAGLCAVEGQMAAEQGKATCAVASQACIEDRASSIGDKADCVPEDFPRCNNVTIDEFIQCTDAMIHSSAAYFGTFTCNSDLASVTEEFVTPTACASAYERCPAMADAEAS